MLRFSIRDVLWLTALSAALAAWGLDHWRLEKRANVFMSWNRVLAERLEPHGEVVQLLPSGMYIDDTWDDGKPSWHPITPGAPYPP
jgi:hypothetical protein